MDYVPVVALAAFLYVHRRSIAYQGKKDLDLIKRVLHNVYEVIKSIFTR
jgi:hypothetical protein